MKLSRNTLPPSHALIAVMFVALLASAPIQAQEANRYIPDSAFGALVFKPNAVMVEPSMDLMPREIIDAFGRTELGLDLMDLNQATLLIDTFEDLDNPPDFAVFFQFESDQTLGGRMGETLEPAEVEGLSGDVQRIDGPEDLVLYTIDSRTMLIGSTPMLIKMTGNNSGASSPLASMINAMPATDHMNLFVDMEMIRTQIKAAMPPANRMPDEARRFRKLPDLIKSISMRHSFAEGGVSEIRVTSNDESDAEKLEFLPACSIDIARDRMMSEGGFHGDDEWGGFGDDDYNDAMLRYAGFPEWRKNSFVRHVTVPIW